MISGKTKKTYIAFLDSICTHGRTGECAYKDAFWVAVFLLHFLCDVYVSIFFNNEKVSKKYFKPFQAF